MNENIDIECEKITFNGKIAELENVDIKALLLQIVEKIGAHHTLDSITDSSEIDLDEIVNFIEDSYDMETALDQLDVERRKELREHLNAG